MRTLLLALAVLPLAGCVQEVLDEERVEVAGRPQSTAPTNLYLKAFVQADGLQSTVAFDRQEWYVAGLEKEMPRIPWIEAAGTRQFNREIVVESVAAPADLEARFRYDRMSGTTPAMRAEMDRAWDARLAELERAAGQRGLALPPGAIS